MNHSNVCLGRKMCIRDSHDTNPNWGNQRCQTLFRIYPNCDIEALKQRLSEYEVQQDGHKYPNSTDVYKRQQQESLRHDSAVTMIRKELIRNDRERERKKYERTCERLNSLVITAPLKGQLSFVKVTLGQQVSSGESIAEIKVLDQYKIHTSISEYYIDRITTGLPATVNYQGRCV